jgi:hypothetical protein
MNENLIYNGITALYSFNQFKLTPSLIVCLQAIPVVRVDGSAKRCHDLAHLGSGWQLSDRGNGLRLLPWQSVQCSLLSAGERLLH